MIVEIAKAHKSKLILSTILSTCASFAGIGVLAAINDAITTDISDAWQALYLLGLIIMMFLVGFLSQFIFSLLGAKVVRSLRESMFQRIINTEFSTLDTIGGHRLLATLNSDVASIAHALTMAPMLFFNLTTLLLCFLYLGYLSVVHLLLLLSILVVAVTVTWFMMRLGNRYFSILREHEDSLFGFVQQLVDGGRELSLSAKRSDFFLNKQALPCMADVYHADVKAAKYWSLSRNWANAMLFFALASVVLSAKTWLPTNIEIISAFLLVITYLIGPLTSIMNSFEGLARGKVAYSKIKSLQIAVSQDLPQHEQPSPLPSTIKITNLTYSYPQKEDDYSFQIGPVTMELPANEVSFICGGNGSGKSSFAKLINGLYLPHDGKIEIGEWSLRSHNVQAYRALFSTIFSDFYLFDTALNSQGNPADDEQINALIEKLELTDKVKVDQGRLSTTKLSHGQRKRLALLLVFLEDSPYYILDEWAADQDPYFRELFYKTLLPELKRKNKTVLVISHDEQYFHVADNLFKFDQGKLVSHITQKHQNGTSLTEQTQNTSST
ncbi:cyclic peptide export ABC transporter [Pseudoalteromonas sp. GCY]|uniref:cyclic peptide export ABC transporter n=1 Tax=Pseudoalteromonas sp. GCY TaxID=2003316 RepID=UPI001555BA07|nr:cyclic peptide export ABC transporter [Pseudoalteromonas sp. GCY]QQQ65449.1 cyclic peptide export ABC transporter [Pseudoalteromonas sp. GCY]